MKLFIPAIGTKIKLTLDWTFTVHPEYRNHDLYELAAQKEIDDYLWDGSSHPAIQFTIPAGVTLSVDRIYIKKPSPDYNSVTFRIPKKCLGNPPHMKCLGNPPHLTGLRFWVKLDDANKIEGDIIP